MKQVANRLIVWSLAVFSLLLIAPVGQAIAATVSVAGQATVTNTDGALDFTNNESNVVVDDATGEFSGYAWSEDLGWIEFGDTDNTEGPVTVDLNTGEVVGRALVLNTDSYLEFSTNNSNVEIDLETGVFSGYVWSTDVGWIDFADTGVSLSDALVTPTPTPGANIYVIIDAELAAGGVESNIGELPDPSQATGLYFEKIGFGKIEFASTLDLTNATVIAWLQDLGNKLDLSTLNKIGLDADLVQELIDTQATLTMYNVTLNNPKILVDGDEDEEGVVTNLVYDQEADTLTFTAAHFTEFTAVEREAGSQPPSTTKAPSCKDESPVGSPDLFEIRSTNTSATIFFAPVTKHVNKYYIAYGTEGLPYQHGVEFTPPYIDGVISYTINDLNPNTAYHFTVRAGNGCAPGSWSQTMEVTTTKNLLQKKSWYWYK